MKEVENSITEFKRQRQEYDEERIREQVCVYTVLLKKWSNATAFLLAKPSYKPILLSLRHSEGP